MRRHSRNTAIDDTCALHETRRALLVAIGDREVWIPRSQIDDSSEVQCVGDSGRLVISSWFAQQEHLQEAARPREEQPNITTLPNATRTFRALAMEFHPDRGGDSRIMQAVNRLWTAIKEDLRGDGGR